MATIEERVSSLEDGQNILEEQRNLILQRLDAQAESLVLLHNTLIAIRDILKGQEARLVTLEALIQDTPPQNGHSSQ